MGSTIPLVPSMDIPPWIPKRLLKVLSATFRASGTRISMESAPLKPASRHTPATCSNIICLGTGLMAAFPTSQLKPHRVTLPTPTPPDKFRLNPSFSYT